MAAPPPLYRKAARRRRTLAGYSQLWIGQGHLLLLKSTRFTEEYQRYSLASIQSIVTTQVSYNPFPAILAILAVTGALAWTYTVLRWLLPIAEIGAVAVVTAVLVDLARGPRCRCALQTAASRHWLPISRIRVARKFLASVGPEIELTQGTLSPERALEIELAGVPGASVAPPQVPASQTRIPWILPGLFLLDAGLLVLATMIPRTAALSGFITAVPAELALCMYLLFQTPQDGGRAARPLIRAVTSLALICLLIDAASLLTVGAGWIIAVFQSSRGVTLPMPDQTLLLTASVLPWFSPAWRAAAGVLGFAAAAWERNRAPGQ